MLNIPRQPSCIRGDSDATMPSHIILCKQEVLLRNPCATDKQCIRYIYYLYIYKYKINTRVLACAFYLDSALAQESACRFLETPHVEPAAILIGHASCAYPVFSLYMIGFSRNCCDMNG
jgi:hypothetical protein